MSKSAVYISIIKRMVPLELSAPILEDPISRGNVAYFIEEYYDSEEWSNMLDKIYDLIEKKDVNALCGFLLSKIYAKSFTSPSVTTNKGIMEVSYSFSKILYEKNKLNIFVSVGPSDFPDWIYEADYVLTE